MENNQNSQISASVGRKEELKKPKRFSNKMIVLITLVVIFLFFSIYQTYKSYYYNPSHNDITLSALESSTPVPTESTEQTDSQSSTTAIPNNSASKKTPSTSSPQPSASSPSTASTSDNSVSEKEIAIEYFLDIALGHQAVERWAKSPVYVGAAPGTLDDAYSTCLDGFVRDFNNTSASIKLERNNELADIKIYVLAPEQMQSDGNQRFGYAYNRRNNSNEYESAEIFLSTDAPNNPLTRCYLIRHELMHTVGFPGHSDSCPEGIMAVAGTVNTNNSMVAVDRKAIQMLYNTGIPLKMNESDARAYINAHYPN